MDTLKLFAHIPKLNYPIRPTFVFDEAENCQHLTHLKTNQANPSHKILLSRCRIACTPGLKQTLESVLSSPCHISLFVLFKAACLHAFLAPAMLFAVPLSICNEFLLYSSHIYWHIIDVTVWVQHIRLNSGKIQSCTCSISPDLSLNESKLAAVSAWQGVLASVVSFTICENEEKLSGNAAK